MKASVSYNGYAFDATGRAWLSQKATYESDSPGAPARRKKNTLVVQHIFREQSYADNQARYLELKAALAVPEGVFVLKDENGAEILRTMVKVEDSDLPAEWGQYKQDVNITFSYYEIIGTAEDQGGLSALYTPTGSGPIQFPGIGQVKEEIRPERFDQVSVPNRSNTMSSVTIQGKVMANPALLPDERKTFLQGIEGSLKSSADFKDGVFVFGAFTKPGFISALSTDLKDDLLSLEYSATFTYRRFPGGDYAEAIYQVSVSTDWARMVAATSVRGTVKASAEAAAQSRTDQIKAQFGAGKTLQREDAENRRAWGTDGSTWIDRNFAMEFTVPLDVNGKSWNITITTKENTQEGTNTITYSGSVRAKNSSLALAKARDLGANKHPIRVSSSEALSSAANNDAAEVFQECTFSYDYTVKGTWIAASITNEVVSDGFSTWAQTVSGSVTASDLAAAQTVAHGYKIVGLMVKSLRETDAKVRVAGTSLFTKMDFSYSYHVVRTDGAIRYQAKTARDYKARRKTTTVTGEAWAENESSAEALITAVLPANVGHIVGDERANNFEKHGTTVFISRSFSASYENSFAADGDDIIEATLTVRSVYSVDQAIITPIPFGQPHVQTNTGVTPGQRTCSGSITVLNQNTGLNWARSKAPSGGYPAPYQEDVQHVFVPFSGTEVQAYTVNFTHTHNYTVLTA